MCVSPPTYLTWATLSVLVSRPCNFSERNFLRRPYPLLVDGDLPSVPSLEVRPLQVSAVRHTAIA